MDTEVVIYIHNYMHMYMYMYMYVHVRMYVCTCMHIHVHIICSAVHIPGGLSLARPTRARPMLGLWLAFCCLLLAAAN